jgi:hypothetical protein
VLPFVCYFQNIDRLNNADYILINLSVALRPSVEPWPLLQFRNLFYTDRTPWRSHQPVARPLPIYRTTQTQNKHTHISMPLSWIRTQDPSVRAKEDSSGLRRRRGHCDRLYYILVMVKLLKELLKKSDCIEQQNYLEAIGFHNWEDSSLYWMGWATLTKSSGWCMQHFFRWQLILPMSLPGTNRNTSVTSKIQFRKIVSIFLTSQIQPLNSQKPFNQFRYQRIHLFSVPWAQSPLSTAQSLLKSWRKRLPYMENNRLYWTRTAANSREVSE